MRRTAKTFIEYFSDNTGKMYRCRGQVSHGGVDVAVQDSYSETVQSKRFERVTPIDTAAALSLLEKATEEYVASIGRTLWKK